MNDAPLFYSQKSLHVEIYDALTAAGWGSLHDDVTFYLEEAGKTEGNILELACGTGRIALPLALALPGREIYGLDASRPMLECADRKRLGLPPEAADRIQFHEGDMARFNLRKQFSLILVAFRSFQILLSSKDQRRCLLQIRKHLSPDSKVILNLFDPRYEFLAPDVKGPIQERELLHPLSGHKVQIKTLMRENDPLTQTFREVWRFTETDSEGSVLRQEEEMIVLKWTFRQEMRLLAESCGFKIEEEYSDFKRSAPAYGREQIWILTAA